MPIPYTGSTECRERGTIVSWNLGVGGIRADNGDSIRVFYWSVLRGFRQLRVGQRVEFSRGIGLNQNAANLVVSIPSEADSS
jgi:cold shock CspA family protein